MPNITDKFRPADVVSEAGEDYPGEWAGGAEWFRQQLCAQGCSGASEENTCPPGMTQFPEVLPGASGYLRYATQADPSSPLGVSIVDGFPFSIVDSVAVPKQLEPGGYLLSWRWDAEQSHQIWQNCADVEIV